MTLYNPRLSFNTDRVISILLLLCVLYLAFKGETSNWRLKKYESIQRGEDAKDVAFFAFDSILKRQVYDLYFSEAIYKVLKNSNALDLDGSESVANIRCQENRCRVVLKGETMLRGFDVIMDADLNNPLYYRIINIKESEIKGGEGDR